MSPRRTDGPGNRLLAHRVADRNGALVTGIPRAVNALTPVLGGMSTTELFSPLGIAEIRRALPEQDGESLLQDGGLDYTIDVPENFRPAATGHEPQPLTAKDIPSATRDFGLRMSEADASPPEGRVWAFTCCDGGERVSIAVIRWEAEPIGTIAIAGTKPKYRQKGYGRAVVSAATEYILHQGHVASYGTVRGNLPALRMIRPLGYRLAYETLYA